MIISYLYHFPKFLSNQTDSQYTTAEQINNKKTNSKQEKPNSIRSFEPGGPDPWHSHFSDKDNRKILITHPRMVRQRILEGARKWMGPWEGLVFMRLRRNLRYFIFWRTSPPERQISSHLTTTTFCPFSNSFANIDASLPSMWCLASTTTLPAQIPDPDTILLSLFLSFSLAESNNGS